MMNWKVTYRGKDGKQIMEVVQAESREALFSLLSKRGISAIRVEEVASLHKKKNQARINAAHHFAIALCICGLIVGAVIFFTVTRVNNKIEPSPIPSRHRASPARAPTPPLPPAGQCVEIVPPKTRSRTSSNGTPIPMNVQPDERGVLRYPGGLRWVDTNNLNKVVHPRKKQLFKHHSENSIATILTLDPDLMAPFLVGRRPRFGKRFVDDFKASLYDEVEFPDDDTDEEREVRRMVVAVKKEMSDALNRGEDIAKMMNDAQDELDRLVSYKATLMKQLKEIKLDENYSDDDIADFTTAANEMLKSQGLKELKMPNLTYRQLLLQRMRERNDNNSSKGSIK